MELLRWLGEPVEMLIIPSDLFVIEHDKRVSLKSSLQSCIELFIDRLNVHLVIKTNFDIPKASEYATFLTELVKNRKGNREYEILTE